MSVALCLPGLRPDYRQLNDVTGESSIGVGTPGSAVGVASGVAVVNWHKCCRGIWDIVTDPRIIDVVADLLGDSVILRHSHLFAKLPGDAKRVAWHQDAS